MEKTLEERVAELEKSRDVYLENDKKLLATMRELHEEMKEQRQAEEARTRKLKEIEEILRGRINFASDPHIQ